MKIRAKGLLSIGGVLLISTVCLYWIVEAVQMNNYRTLEVEAAGKDIERFKKIFVSELTDLAVTTEDWGSWDDTYQFAVDHNPDYVQSNLQPLTPLDMGLNYIVILDSAGNTVSEVGVHLKKERKAPVPGGLLSQLSKGKLVDGLEDSGTRYGVIEIGGKALLISASPILKSNSEGPMRGVFSMSRYLDRAKMNEFSEKTQLNLIIVKRNSKGFPERLTNIATTLMEQLGTASFSLENMPTYLEYVDEQNLRGHIMIPNMDGDPLLLATISISRDIYNAGLDSLKSLLIALIIAGALLTFSVLAILDRMVLRPLSKLGSEVSEIGTSSDLSIRVDQSGKDEFAVLGGHVNSMLSQLQTSEQRIVEEHDRAEALLLNILPAPIAEQLKSGSGSIADHYEEVSILFADIVGFTEISTRVSATELVDMLNDVFSRFDDLADRFGLEKIKTIGDAYMVAAGIPEPMQNHAEAVAEMALAMLDVVQDASKSFGEVLQVRIGINSGVVIAGVIGKKKFIYDLWGDAVNIASRMESSGEVGMIQVSQATYERIQDKFSFKARGEIQLKGRGKMPTYSLIQKCTDDENSE